MSTLVLQAVVQAAVDVTAASAGWALVVRGDHAEVVAAAGEGAVAAIGVTIASGSGSAGFVLASGQPLAIAPRPDDPMAGEGVAAAVGRRPASILCVPCDSGHEMVGALELVDKAGGGPFSFDDVELATVLAGIAGAALGEADVRAVVPDPGQLAGDLARLATADPTRYAAVASAVSALLAGG